MPLNNINQDNYDVQYGLSTVSITTTGSTIVSTKSAFYHGMAAIPGTTAVTIFLYDNASTTTGSLLDIVAIGSGKSVWIDRYIPVVAKSGIVASVTGTGAKLVVFYGPKG